MFCTRCRIHLYSGLSFGGKSEKRFHGIMMNPDLEQILSRVKACQEGLPGPVGPSFTTTTTVLIRALNSKKRGPSDICKNGENGFLERRWPGRPAAYLGTRKSHFLPFKIGSARRGSGTDRPYHRMKFHQKVFSEENDISFQYPLIKLGLIWKAISCGLLATKPTPDVAAELFPIRGESVIKSAKVLPQWQNILFD